MPGPPLALAVALARPGVLWTQGKGPAWLRWPLRKECQRPDAPQGPVAVDYRGAVEGRLHGPRYGDIRTRGQRKPRPLDYNRQQLRLLETVQRVPVNQSAQTDRDRWPAPVALRQVYESP